MIGLNKYLLIGSGAIIAAISVAYFFKTSELSELKAQLAAEREKALEQSLQLQTQIEDLRLKNEKENQDASVAIANLRKRIADGVHISSVQSVSKNSGTQDRKDECRLSREFADRLVSIAEKGDRAIRALNQCIDSYNALRDKQNEKRGEASNDR